MRGRYRKDIVQQAAQAHRITDEVLFYRAFAPNGDAMQLNLAAQAFKEYVQDKKKIPRVVIDFCGQTFPCARPDCQEHGNARYTRVRIPGNIVDYFCSPDCMTVDVSTLLKKINSSTAQSKGRENKERPVIIKTHEAAKAQQAITTTKPVDKSHREPKAVAAGKPAPQTEPAPPHPSPAPPQVLFIPVPFLVPVPVFIEVPVPVLVPVPSPADGRVTVAFEMSLSPDLLPRAPAPATTSKTVLSDSPSPPPRKKKPPHLWGSEEWGKKQDCTKPKESKK